MLNWFLFLPRFVISSILMFKIRKSPVNVSDSRAWMFIQSSTAEINFKRHFKLIATVNVQPRIRIQLPEELCADSESSSVHDRRLEVVASLVFVFFEQWNPLRVETPIEDSSAFTQRSDLVSFLVDNVKRRNHNCTIIVSNRIEKWRQIIVTSFDVTIHKQQNIAGCESRTSQTTPNQSGTFVHHEQLDFASPALSFDVRLKTFVKRFSCWGVVNQDDLFEKLGWCSVD